MGKITTFMVAGIAMMTSQMAQAEIYRPPGTWVMTGPVTITPSTGVKYSCTLTLTVTVPNDAGDSHGSAPHGDTAWGVPSASGGFPCSMVNFNAPPYKFSYVTISSLDGTLTLNNVDITGCPLVNIDGLWQGLPMTWDINATFGSCAIVGTLSVTSPSLVVIQ